MTRIRFDSETALNVPNLNKLNNVVISPTEPTTGEEVWIQKGKNLLSGIIENYTLDGNGGISAYNGYFVTEFIKVKPNTSYIASGFSTQHKEWYDEDFSLISNTGDNPAISPSNAKYLRMNGSTSSSSNMQIEQGSTATSYEPYIENKIYTKNDNGVYEEIYDEERINELSNENDASLLHQNYIGTEHILLGILREIDSIAVRILLDLNVSIPKLYNKINIIKILIKTFK